MPRLYVSDLDGTLLRSDATLSELTRTRLARLLNEGLPFTVASARSVVAMQFLLRGLPIRLPVIELNGALVSDLHSGQHLVVHAIRDDLVRDLYALLHDRGRVPFISSVDGRRDYLSYSAVAHEGMRWYVDDRKAARDERLRFVDDLTECFDQEVVAVTLVDRRDAIEETAAVVSERFPDAFALNLFENGYSPGWFWLTIHDPRATKDQAIAELLDSLGLEPRDLVVFGDHWNDIPMFRLAGTAIAVENADPEVKKHASAVIGPNDADSVVRYILRAERGP